WPWYVFGRTFFEGVGAEFCQIDGKQQMLLGEIVYEIEDFAPCGIRRSHCVGGRAIREFEAVPEFNEAELAHKDTDYFGSIAPFVHQMLGRCLVRCQEIEHNLARSFI